MMRRRSLPDQRRHLSQTIANDVFTSVCRLIFSSNVKFRLAKTSSVRTTISKDTVPWGRPHRKLKLQLITLNVSCNLSAIRLYEIVHSLTEQYVSDSARSVQTSMVLSFINQSMSHQSSDVMSSIPIWGWEIFWVRKKTWVVESLRSASSTTRT